MLDLLVVGAGPAGSSAARYAARAGLDVLVVDKRQEIGAPKRCGEGLVLCAVERDGIPVDERWVAQRIRGMRFFGPAGRSTEARESRDVGLVVERKMFDKHLATLAVREGARVRAHTAAEAVRRDGTAMRVSLSSGTRRWEEVARCVVIAEGREASLVRSLGLAAPLPPAELNAGVQYEMAGIAIDDPTLLTIWLGRSIAGKGYIWLFPKGDDRANVGITIRGTDVGVALAMLDRFIASRPELARGSVLEVNAATIPVAEGLDHIVANGLLVAGDCARQTNPIHAGGIAEALEAGRFAGETAAEAVARNDTSAASLAEYERRWERGYGGLQRRLVKARRAIDSLTDEDLDYLVDTVGSKDIAAFVGTGSFSSAARLLAGRPSLLRVLLA